MTLCSETFPAFLMFLPFLFTLGRKLGQPCLPQMGMCFNEKTANCRAPRSRPLSAGTFNSRARVCRPASARLRLLSGTGFTPASPAGLAQAKPSNPSASAASLSPLFSLPGALGAAV